MDPFSLPHNPFADEKIQIIPIKDARTCEDAQDWEKLAQSLEGEIKTRAILDERQEGGVIPHKIDHSFVWGELREEARNILVFGRSFGQSDSFQRFLEKLIAWSQRLLVTEEDEVQTAPIEEETKDLSIREESDTEVKIFLGQAANAGAVGKGKK
ncbi:hypothetical protein DL767_002611 [Monosporascus sp. MG133]|nr:hypothetical protein DL767_002611 [Monosporascus sp. MG133]